MKTIEINLYSYNELSDEAKEKALENYQNDPYTGTYWMDENIDSILKALDFFECAVKDYSITYYNSNLSYVDFTRDEDILELSYIRLWKYIQNNYSTYRNQYTKKIDNTFAGNCPFTGISMDEGFLDPIREFLRKPTDITFEELIEDCIHSCLVQIEREYEYQMSEEYFIDHCECNDYEFTADGEMY